MWALEREVGAIKVDTMMDHKEERDGWGGEGPSLVFNFKVI